MDELDNTYKPFNIEYNEYPEYAQDADPRGILPPYRPNDWKVKMEAMWDSTTMLGNLTKKVEMDWVKKHPEAYIGEVSDSDLEGILREGYKGSSGGLNFDKTYTEDGFKTTPTRVDALLSEVLDIKAKYGGNAAKVRAIQMRDDVLNGNVINNLSLLESLGYGAATMMVDPLFWATGGVATGAVRVGTGAVLKTARALTGKAMQRDVLTQSIRTMGRTRNKIAIGDTLETLTRWAAISGTESLITNTARLYGDVTYTIRDLKNDVMMESLFGGSLGFLGGAWKANSRRMASRIDAKKNDIRQELHAQRREVTNDKSNFEVDELTGRQQQAPAPISNTQPNTFKENIRTAYKEQLFVKDDMLKMNPNTLRVTYNDFTRAAGGPEAAGIVDLNDKVMVTHASRLANADNTQKWLSEAALDSVSQLNGTWLHTRDALSRTTRVTEGQELFDENLAYGLRKAWEDTNRQIRLLGKDFGVKAGASPEAIADNIQAVMYLNDKLKVIAKDAEQDIVTLTQKQKYTERGNFKDTPWENEEYLIKDYTAELANYENMDLGIELRNPMELPNTRSEELNDLPLALRQVHANRKNKASKIIKAIVRPNTNAWEAPPLSLRDVDKLSQRQLNVVIDTLINTGSTNTGAYKVSGILPKLKMLRRVMQGTDSSNKAMVDIAQKLALDYTTIASYYAKTLPMYVANKMSRVHFGSRKIYINNALEGMLDGATDMRTKKVNQYVKYMKQSDSMTALGDDITPMSYDELMEKNIDLVREDVIDESYGTWLTKRNNYEYGDIKTGNIDSGDDLVTPEFSEEWSSSWMDTVDRDAFSAYDSPLSSAMQIVKRMNEDAVASADNAFMEAVEELNGVVDKRLIDMELNVLRDPAQPYITKELSLEEGRIHLAQLGWSRRDKGYIKELKRIRKSGGDMSTNVKIMLEDVLKDTGEVDLLPRNIAMFNKEKLLDIVNVETLTELRSKLHKQILEPLDLYGKPTADYRRLAKINSRKAQLVRNASRTIETMIRKGDVGMLGDTIAAAATIRADRLRRTVQLEKRIASNKKRQQAIAYKNSPVETKDPEVPAKVAQQLAVKINVLKSAIAETDRTIKLGTYEEGNILSKSVVSSRVEVGELIRELEDLVGENSVSLASLKKQATELEVELLTTKTEIPDSGSSNALNSGNLDTIADGVGTGSPELEIPDKVVKAAAPLIANKSWNKVMSKLGDWLTNDSELAKLNVEPRSTSGWVGYHIGRGLGLTQDLATTFQKEGATVMQYLGHNVTEMGRGHAGANQRNMTGGVIREAEYTASIMQMIPEYVRAMNAFAINKGSNAVGRLNAAVQNGANDINVDAFNRAFILEMNNKSLGKQTPPANEEIADFVEAWNKYMNYNMERLVDEGIQGFTAKKVINYYVPQIWNTQKINEAFSSNPLQVRQLFEKGYASAGHTNSAELAEKQITYLMGMSDDFDQHMPNMEGRAKHQIRIDKAVELDGLNMLDLMDTEVAKLGMVYSNRLAGHIGLAKSTDGMLNSLQDINTLRNVLEQEVPKGDKSLQDFDDLIDLMYGRPPRGGLQEWMRDFKDLAVYTRMGGLGTAQSIETATVATRGLLEAAADPKFLKKLTQGMSPEDTAEDLQELMKMSGYNWDFEWLNRQSVHLDVKAVDTMSKLKARGNQLADFATFGKLKAPTSRLLGKVTGYNAIRKYQSAAIQRSYGFTITRHFKNNSSKMSVERLADIGITDTLGKNEAMRRNIVEHVEFDADGYPTKYNFDKWDTDVRQQFQYGMQRVESQDMQRALVGESMRWMNKPIMQMIAQFRNMPLIAQNKALARSMAFADREAVTTLALNTMTAGLVRAAKVATLAGGTGIILGTEWGDEFDKKWYNAGHDAQMPGAMDKYITQLGFLADGASLATVAGDTWQRVSTAQTGFEGAGMAVDAVMGQIPALGTMQSGFNTGIAMGKGDAKEAVKEVQGYTPLGTTAMMEMLFTGLEKEMGD